MLKDISHIFVLLQLAPMQYLVLRRMAPVSTRACRPLSQAAGRNSSAGARAAGVGAAARGSGSSKRPAGLRMTRHELTGFSPQIDWIFPAATSKRYLKG